MTRYFARPKQRVDIYEDDYSISYDVVVHEALAVKTGLITDDGRDIMRSPNPVGFTAKID